MKKKLSILIFALTYVYLSIQCQETPEDEIKFAAGRRIITSGNQWTYQETLEYVQFDIGHQYELENVIAYGIIENYGLVLRVPFFLNRRLFDEEINRDRRSGGIGDISLQGEWIFMRTDDNVARFIHGLLFPTGDITKSPLTGSDSIAVILETAFVHESENWYSDFGFGTRIRLKNFHRTRRLGSIFSYSFSLGPRMQLRNHPEHIFFLIMQLEGEYLNPTDFIKGVGPRIGGHFTLLGPLLSWEHKNINVEFFFQWPIAQREITKFLTIEWRVGFTLELKY